MEINYAYTIVYVADVPATMGFYQDVFGFAQRLITPEQDYGELDTGHTVLAFANEALGNSNFSGGFLASHLASKPFGVELVFACQDVATLYNKALAHGAVALAEITQKPWGQTVGYLRDPNGMVLELCTPMAAPEGQ